MAIQESIAESKIDQTATPAFNGYNPTLAADQALMSKIAEAVKAAGKILLQRFSPESALQI